LSTRSGGIGPSFSSVSATALALDELHDDVERAVRHLAEVEDWIVFRVLEPATVPTSRLSGL